MQPVKVFKIVFCDVTSIERLVEFKVFYTSGRITLLLFYKWLI